MTLPFEDFDFHIFFRQFCFPNFCFLRPPLVPTPTSFRFSTAQLSTFPPYRAKNDVTTLSKSISDPRFARTQTIPPHSRSIPRTINNNIRLLNLKVAAARYPPSRNMATDLILPPDEDIKPDFSAEEAGGFLKELFGLDCLKIAELNGYDDKNYKVDVSGGNQVGYVLKIMNSLDSGNLALVEGCNALLQFLGELFPLYYLLARSKNFCNKDNYYLSLHRLIISLNCYLIALS